MCDWASIVRLEAAHDLPARRNDAHGAIVAAEKEAFGPGAHTGDIVTCEEGARIVVGDLDLGCVEEVKRPPLRAHGVSSIAAVGGVVLPSAPWSHFWTWITKSRCSVLWQLIVAIAGVDEL